MTFSQFIKQLNPTQVDTWWQSIAPNQAPEKVEDENWKYRLLKNGRALPFKWSISELAKHYNISFNNKDFDSNVANRDAFCEAFDFEIHEDLVYDDKENKEFSDFYNTRVSNKETFQSFIHYANELIQKNSINPYKIRMALTYEKKKATLILGMRAVLQYSESNDNAVVGLILQNNFIEALNNKNFDSVYPFKGNKLPKSFVTLSINQWNEIPIEILENNLISIKEQYDLIKNSKRVTWNVEANSTNSVLKYLVFKGDNVEEWIKNKTRVHYSKDFFTENEFDLLYETNGIKNDPSYPDLVNAYKVLKEAYNKVEFWTKQTTKYIIPNALIKINKRPTNQANNFDGYLWSKIYPTVQDLNDEWLAITLVLDNNYNFIVKIDTVGLKKGLKYDHYIKLRGDYNNSPLVKIINFKNSKVKDWNGLLDFTSKSINELLVKYREIKLDLSSDSISKENKETMQTKAPINQILYGPPGTGKTYHTILEAAKIITGNEKIGFDAALDVFNTNLHNQIEFITFHQNYSYEDFIQGLRPDTENGNALTFDKKDGVFKRIADKALKNLTASNNPESVKKEFKDVFNELIQPLNNEEVNEIEIRMKKSSYFITEVGEKSIAFRKNIGDSEHTLSINTLHKMYDKGKNDFILGGLQPYYNPLLQLLLDKGKSTVTAVNKKNYVIIIDEINRANISRVFGELITLIEEDKRSHGEIPMTVTLPSGDPFTVPSNLYIIGTMNTADKSIALLDIALRRRFEFVPMYPKYSGLEKPVNDNAILFKINEAIIKRKGHDFTIGHSYFMGENYSLEKTINHKVIPLLLEYFMNDEKEVTDLLKDAGIRIGEWPLKMIS